MTYIIQMLIDYLQVPCLQCLSLKAVLIIAFKALAVPLIQAFYIIGVISAAMQGLTQTVSMTRFPPPSMRKSSHWDLGLTLC